MLHFILKKNLCFLTFLFSMGLFLGCTRNQKPELIIYGKDSCEHCRMLISDSRFGGQIVTEKGKVFLFDSVNCLHSYLESKDLKNHKIYFVDSLQKDLWINSEDVVFEARTKIRSPMGAGIFSSSRQNKNSKDSKNGAMTWSMLSTELSSGKYQ